MDNQNNNYNNFKQRTKVIYKELEQMAQPSDLDSENAVLATLMHYPEYYSQYSDMLNKDLFYNDKEKSIFMAVDGVLSAGNLANIPALADYAVSHKLPYKLSSTDFANIFQCGSPNTFKQDLERITSLSNRRRAWHFVMIAANSIQDRTKPLGETLNALTAVLGDIQSDSEDEHISSFSDALSELSEIVEGNLKGKRISVATGFKLFDNYCLLRPNTLTIIAAFTSVGKSALAMNITMHAAKEGIPVGYYSLEMGKAELASRALSGTSGLSSSRMMNKKLEDSELKDFREAVEKDRSLPIYIDERATVSFDRTIRSIRTLKKAHDIGLVIIDYLQIYAQVSDNAEQSLGYMARASKNIAKELGIPVVLLSQLNRSGDHPSIKMLRGSGQIEESADNIVLIDRPEAYPDNAVNKYSGEFKDASIHGTAKLILAKGRGVGTGCELIGFEPRYTQFYELDDTPMAGDDASLAF